MFPSIHFQEKKDYKIAKELFTTIAKDGWNCTCIEAPQYSHYDMTAVYKKGDRELSFGVEIKERKVTQDFTSTLITEEKYNYLISACSDKKLIPIYFVFSEVKDEYYIFNLNKIDINQMNKRTITHRRTHYDESSPIVEKINFEIDYSLAYKTGNINDIIKQVWRN